jgi:hypothetical protein
LLEALRPKLTRKLGGLHDESNARPILLIIAALADAIRVGFGAPLNDVTVAGEPFCKSWERAPEVWALTTTNGNEALSVNRA